MDTALKWYYFYINIVKVFDRLSRAIDNTAVTGTKLFATNGKIKVAS